MLWNAKEAPDARNCGDKTHSGVRVSRPGCREPSGLLPTRRWSPRTGLALYPLCELGTVTFRCEPGRSHRPCHPPAISSGQQRYAAVGHGHLQDLDGWTPGSDPGWGSGPKLHGMQGVEPCRGAATSAASGDVCPVGLNGWSSTWRHPGGDSPRGRVVGGNRWPSGSGCGTSSARRATGC
jgi:hypothetical protein